MCRGPLVSESDNSTEVCTKQHSFLLKHNIFLQSLSLSKETGRKGQTVGDLNASGQIPYMSDQSGPISPLGTRYHPMESVVVNRLTPEAWRYLGSWAFREI